MTSQKHVKMISNEIQNLVDLSKGPTSITRKAGDVVIKKGDPGNFLYLISKGAVDIIYNDIKLERVSAGGIIGEMSLVDKAPRSATVIAHKDSVLIPIGQARFLHLVRLDPNFAIEVMNTMIRRIRQMNVRMEKSG